jgi:LacI family transcriptional regulator
VGGALMASGEASPAGRARLEDVARAAGVSPATVDRVVNRREGVRQKTIARVEAAVAKLGYRADPAAARLARNQSFRFALILPTGSNTFMANLTEQVQRSADWLASQRAFIDVVQVDVFDPDALAGALEQLSPAYHGVATVALDHPRVRAAIDDLVVRNVAGPLSGADPARALPGRADRSRSGTYPHRHISPG